MAQHVRKWAAFGRGVCAVTAVAAVGFGSVHTAGAAVTAPQLEKVLGRSNMPNEADDEFRMDFVIRVPHGETITSMKYDNNWNGSVDTTATLASGIGMGQEYQVVSTVQDGADDLITVTLRGDAGDSTVCPSKPITASVSVTTASGSTTFADPEAWRLPANQVCNTNGRPVVRLPYDNAWTAVPGGIPSGNSQSGFGAITTDGIVTPTENTFVIDAANPNSVFAPNDCGKTDSVSYQWVKEDNSPTLLTPTPVAHAVVSHTFDNGSKAFTLPTQDFTADGPGYYKLVAWPNAVSANGSVDCTGRTYTPGNFANSEYFQVGSVFYNFAAPVTTTTTSTTSTTTTSTTTAPSTTTTTAPAASADLQIVKSVSSPNGTEVGDQITYTIVATNNGPDTAANVVVTDHLPSGVTYVSSTASAGSYDSATGLWTVGNLANGGTQSLQITATVTTADPSGTLISNTASGTSDTADPNAANNSGVAEFTGTPLVAPLVALVLAVPAGAAALVMRRRRRTV